MFPPAVAAPALVKVHGNPIRSLSKVNDHFSFQGGSLEAVKEH